MSDVTSVPAAEAPFAPAPEAANQVEIPQQIDRPQPIGSQAPDKPPEIQGTRHKSTREAIEHAFKRAGETPRPKPARAEMGHNKPPEPMEKEAQAEEKFDLRKKPREQPRENGRFVRAPEAAQSLETEQAAEPPAEQAGQQPGQPVRKGPQLPENAPYRDPPARMHPQAQADWHAAPETVRGEVYRMAKEYQAAYQQYAGDHQEMNQIRQYQQMAQQHGTTLAKALNNYTNMEQLLRTDPIAGLDLIVNNLNLQNEGRKITLQDVAYFILSQSPEQMAALRTQNQTLALQHQMARQQQQTQALAAHQQAMYHRQQFAAARQMVDAIASQSPRFDELGDIIYAEVAQGYDLPTAIRRAELLRPTHAAQTRTPSAQTRPQDRSISGAPDGPVNGSARQKGPPPSTRQAVADAIRQVNGSF